MWGVFVDEGLRRQVDSLNGSPVPRRLDAADTDPSASASGMIVTPTP